MKVKIGELKDQLSHYLRIVRETGQDVEVCVRDEPVAMLQSIERASRTPNDVVRARLSQRLLDHGLLWHFSTEEDAEVGDLPPVTALMAGESSIA